tara:strand:+ start:287 stop:484 length:198 start_codon:yes stop_codon:yes gene_type:complete
VTFGKRINVLSIGIKTMKKSIFKTLAKLNKAVLPSYSKQQLDLSKASKVQLAIFVWRVFITKNAL